MKNTMFKILVFAIMSVALVGSANAALIQGSISMGSAFRPIDSDSPPNVVSLDAATGIDFYYLAQEDKAPVSAATGDFLAYLPVVPIADIYDFQFSSPFTSVIPLWEIGGFSFDLETVNIQTQNSTTLLLTGTGKLYGNGFDETIGTWNLSSQGQSGQTLSWSSTTEPIPEPATMLLFGTGLVGLAGLGRRRLRKK